LNANKEAEPGLAPGTGCPEPGGWTTRELKAILRRLTSLRIVGADVVEVAPPYDDAGESTAWAAADLVYELFGLMVAKPPYEVEGYVGKKVHERKKGWTAKPTAKTEL
jgi:agmatinase